MLPHILLVLRMSQDTELLVDNLSISMRSRIIVQTRNVEEQEVPAPILSAYSGVLLSPSSISSVLFCQMKAHTLT